MFKIASILLAVLVAINFAKNVYSTDSSLEDNVKESETLNKNPIINDDSSSNENQNNEKVKRNMFMWSSHMKNPEELIKKLAFQRMLEKKLRNMESEKKKSEDFLQNMKKYFRALF